MRRGALHGNSVAGIGWDMSLPGLPEVHRQCVRLSSRGAARCLRVPRHGEEYSKPADSGRPIVRRFCPECGSSIAEEPGSRPDLIILNGGTLDDPNSLTPAMQIYCDRELSWVRLNANMQRFPGMPAEP